MRYWAGGEKTISKQLALVYIKNVTASSADMGVIRDGAVKRSEFSTGATCWQNNPNSLFSASDEAHLDLDGITSPSCSETRALMFLAKLLLYRRIIIVIIKKKINGRAMMWERAEQTWRSRTQIITQDEEPGFIVMRVAVSAGDDTSSQSEWFGPESVPFRV